MALTSGRRDVAVAVAGTEDGGGEHRPGMFGIIFFEAAKLEGLVKPQIPSANYRVCRASGENPQCQSQGPDPSVELPERRRSRANPDPRSPQILSPVYPSPIPKLEARSSKLGF